MLVYIVQDTELGWDSVVAVFTKEEDAKACVKDRDDLDYKDRPTCTYSENELDDPDFENGIFIA